MTDTPDSSTGPSGYEGYVVDAENAAEMARLMIQDHLLTQAMGGLVPEQSDLSQVYHVLDIACGSGGWLLDLVTQYPHLQGVGIDISHLMMEYATSLTKSQGLSNVQFVVMDATQPLRFPDNTFDLVNGRILTGFLSTHQWSALLQECARITRPGGFFASPKQSGDLPIVQPMIRSQVFSLSPLTGRVTPFPLMDEPLGQPMCYAYYCDGQAMR